MAATAHLQLPALQRAGSAPAPPSAAQTRTGGAALGQVLPRVSLSARPASGGQPLAGAVRQAVERSTGARLGDVRVHQGGPSSAALDAAGARAVTYGSQIYLASRESQADLALMAHEAAHVLQQRGGARPQAKSAAGGAGGALEHEADQVASSAARGAPMAVAGRTAPQPQFMWDSLANLGKSVRQAAGGLVDAVGSKIAAAGAAIAEGLDAVRLKAIAYVRERAASVPGYDLLGFAIGRDPLTQAPIDRNATTLLQAVLGLVPGGAQIFQELQQSKVLEKAYTWVSGELQRLGLTWARVRAAVEAFIATLGLGDLVNLAGVFARAKAMFASIIDSAISFAKACGRKLLELAFEGAMLLAGSAGKRVMGVVQKVGDTFGLIAANPGGFFANLGAAILGGFEQFRDRFGTHLQTALVGWLFSALQGAGLKLPEKFDLKGILSLVLQVLGLTYDNLRKRLVDLVGETVVSTVETTLDFVVTLVRDGVAAAWEKIVEFAGNVKDMLIGAIKDFIGKTILGEALKLVAKMLVPGGALITLCIKIYETVIFVIEKAKALLDFVEAVTDSIANIARGNIGAAKNYVEKTLAKMLPLVISFLAKMVGLGGISGHIKKAIENIQAPINTALNKVVAWIKEKAKALVAKAGALIAWWKKRAPFRAKDGKQHQVEFGGEGDAAVLGVRSEFTTLATFLEKGSKDTGTAAEKKLRQEIKDEMAKLDTLLKALKKEKKGPSVATQARKDDDVQASLTVIAQKLAQLGGNSGLGSEEAPIPLLYPKRAIADYRPLWIGPKSKKAIKQALLEKASLEDESTVTKADSSRYAIAKKLDAAELAVWTKRGRGKSIQKFVPQDDKQLPDGGLKIGVSLAHRVATGFKLQLKPKETEGGGEINSALEPYGFRASEETPKLDGDHVVEMQLGGENKRENLWPLKYSENRSSGSTLSKLEVPEPGGDGKNNISMTDLKKLAKAKNGNAVWLVIAGKLSTKD